MRKPIQISIPQPCHEKWDEMTPTDKGRFCAACQKNVIDLTKVSDREIVQLIKSNKNLCGRFSPSQLNRDLIVPKEKSTVWTAIAATVISFITLGSHKATAQETLKTEQTENINSYETIGILTGVVRDKNDVLPDVTIINKTNNETTVSLLSGNYEILADKGDIIEFYLDGYITQTITVKSNPHKNVKLKKDKNYNEQEQKTGPFVITGTVNDETGPLPSANIVIKGTSISTQADINGNYSIEVKKGDILEFLYVGYTTKEITVNNLSEINITMTSAIMGMGAIEVRRSFIGRVFHSIGNFFR
ncbi:carboxypeptidase-like regulatory domain-containing protein [Flavobacterium sp. ST-75]|uniref:Carboxypeptidase-like regulatory domain-containing protein n=1 Tax=Flavobacterium rhizophilum TaxID=3163296 RepID=A0ABW8YHD9_9FLAO